jgi:hypothetical protein
MELVVKDWARATRNREAAGDGFISGGGEFGQQVQS